MFDKIVTKKIKYLFDLIRLNKPIGFLLLLWPCWFALANLQQNNLELIKWYVYFFFGAFLMRSAGCIINDIIDINLDKKIERTAERPLTSKKVSIVTNKFEAINVDDLNKLSAENVYLKIKGKLELIGKSQI